MVQNFVTTLPSKRSGYFEWNGRKVGQVSLVSLFVVIRSEMVGCRGRFRINELHEHRTQLLYDRDSTSTEKSSTTVSVMHSAGYHEEPQ